MAAIDLDHQSASVPTTRRRTVICATIGAALALAAVGAAVARPAPADTPAPIRTHVVTVLAIPADGAAMQIVTPGGQPIVPTPGAPVQMTARPAEVSVLTRADSTGGSCAIFLNGVVVAQDQAAREGQPASCVWPR